MLGCDLRQVNEADFRDRPNVKMLFALPRIRPTRLRLVKEPFDHPDYVFELKHDGFRAITYIQNGECKLISGNQNNLRFESLKRTLAKLPVENAIIDGEVICIDERGVSQFNWLLSAASIY
jgi:bifunctional non-homologous end joining protein LigD